MFCKSRAGNNPPLPMVASRVAKKLASIIKPISPVSEKSNKVVNSVKEWAIFSPRAAKTAKAVQSIVPPTQKPKTLISLAPVTFCTMCMVSIMPFSIKSSQVSLHCGSVGLIQPRKRCCLAQSNNAQGNYPVANPKCRIC